MLNGHKDWTWTLESPCNRKLRFVCESDPVDENLSEIFQGCPYGFEFKQGNFCYGNLKDKLVWADAETKCQCRGAHLVSITSQEEFNYIRLLRHFLNRSKWIGLTNQGSGNNSEFY